MPNETNTPQTEQDEPIDDNFRVIDEWQEKNLADSARRVVGQPEGKAPLPIRIGAWSTAVIAAGVGAHAGAELIHTVIENNDRATAAIAEAAPKPIPQQEIDALIDNARKTHDPNIQFGKDIIVTGPETSLYEEALAQVPPNLLEINRDNIQRVLLESSKTANTNQPGSPYITHPGQVYEVIMTKLNDDKYGEFVLALKADNLGQLPLPPAIEGTSTLPAPDTH